MAVDRRVAVVVGFVDWFGDACSRFEGFKVGDAIIVQEELESNSKEKVKIKLGERKKSTKV